MGFMKAVYTWYQGLSADEQARVRLNMVEAFVRAHRQMPVPGCECLRCMVCRIIPEEVEGLGFGIAKRGKLEEGVDS